MPSRVKTPQSQAGPLNNQGQALIEYVLMLIITVSLILALATQIFTPLQSFLKSYMGDYVQCLLEVGELPTLSGDSTAAADAGCNAKFESASVANGRPPKDAGPGSGGSGSGSGEGSSRSGSSSSSSDGSSSGGGSGSYAGSSSRNGSSSMISRNRGPSGLDGSGGDAGKVTEIPVDSGQASTGFFSPTNNTTIYVRNPKKTTSVGIAGLSEADRKKIEKRDIANKRQAVASEGGDGPPPKKLIVKPPEPKKTFEAEEKGFSIGNFIRFMFIAAIVIILLIFIGGQALQMSKGMEK